MTVPVVIYAAKSSEDTGGSIPTQLADCRAAIEGADTRTIIGVFQDEAVSAYKRSRGPGLAAALAAAEQAAEETGEAELWVQHSDRLARGDGRKGGARHLGALFFECRSAGVQLRSVQDDGNLEDAIRAVLIGERNFEDSKRKSAATKDGLKRRKDAGRPVGPIPLGYQALRQRPEDEAKTRVVREAEADAVRQIFAMLADGATPGEAVRSLNAAGLKTKRGGAFSTRRLRELARNRAYIGENGYPRIVDNELFVAANAALDRRSQPPGQRQGLGGREPRDQYMLRGLATCEACGSTLYVRTYDTGRRYVCGHARLADGMCDAPPIRADVLEGAVLSQLERFVGQVGQWVDERLASRREELQSLETSAQHERQQLRTLERRLERAEKSYDRALDADDDDRASAALDQLARVRGELDKQNAKVSDVAARVEEWSSDPDAEAATAWVTEVLGQIGGRIKRAEGSAEIAAALRSALSEVTAKVLDDTVKRDAAGMPRKLLEVKLVARTVLPDGTVSVRVGVAKDTPFDLDFLREALTTEPSDRPWYTTSP